MSDNSTPVVAEPVVEPAVATEDRSNKLLALEEAFFSKSEATKPVEPEAKAEEPTAPAPEVKPEPTVTKEDDFTKRFAQLSKMEAQLRAREDKLKDHQEAMNELAELRELKTMAKSDPLKVAQALGISINDLAEQTINQESFKEKKTINEVDDRLRKLEEMTTSQKEAEAKAKEEQYAQEYVNKVVHNINSAADKFQLVKDLPGGIQLVINTISEYYQRTGEELPWNKAAEMTEDYLMDQKIKEFEQLTKIDKIKAKLNLTAGPAPVVTKPVEKPTKPVTTISNHMASAPATKEVGKTSKEERERRIRELSDRLFE